ncbi:type II toxin-antitoxin system RelE/ParE family toxin [Zwartia vadi]|uniref:type II toxin-antitoxin system RelE/ParE family toxin n=1 Tax=Zwartia vadi TaxID=3058168 RepID=UPI0025B43422|nr:type II toxin-antitoxin system RelE/ParE family toxin [Zwartia vadi]MDN3987442.1 type II toxin-antitoxin system RelE/ParE family toxin [Zwartia vadi]
MPGWTVEVFQSAIFARSYKKLHKKQKIDVDAGIEEIIKDPQIGTQKRGDLSGVYVYKFKSQKQEILLAYEFDPKTRYLLLLGTHENFYRDLKR